MKIRQLCGSGLLLAIISAQANVDVALSAPSIVAPDSFVSTPQEAFQTAYNALKEGKLDAVRSQLPSLRTYPLYPWLEYEMLQQSFANVSDQAILNFIERYPNSVMSDDLYKKWAERLAGVYDWSVIVKHIPANHSDVSLQCYRILALDKTGQTDTALEQGLTLLRDNSKGLPAPCLDVIALLNDHQRLSAQDYWRRIGLATRDNQTTFAQALSKYLPADQQAYVALWADVRSDPKETITKNLDKPDTPQWREIMIYGLERISLKKLEDAQALWANIKDKFHFTEADMGTVDSDFGMWEAWRQDRNGLTRLHNIKPEYRTANGNEWLARIGVRYGAWEDVLSAINGMDKKAAQDDAWRYWKAKALLATGQTDTANQLFNQLAKDATFYGFLAADQLGIDYAALNQNAPDRSQRVNGLKKVAAIQRWQAWMALGQREKARKEWFRTLDEMDKDGILAAAELATQQGDPNLTIWTVSRTEDWNVVDLRFPLNYQDLVLNSSREQGVNPAWVFGVMRRESAFDAGATSQVNALGLMQLMPATARGVSKQLGLSIAANDEILKPETNVQLGSAYLKSMLSKFSNDYARATAAYNAGPQRIPKWSPDTTINADQWVESIPYKETRQYVRAVMGYTTVYDHKLHRDQGVRLSNRLKPIEKMDD